MIVIRNLEEITRPFKNAVVTIGNFDGVHKGHKELFREARKKAENIGGTSVVITFEPHPLSVLKKSSRPPLITMIDQKVELISETGVDVLIVMPFNREFASIGARFFLKDLLVDRIGMKAIVIGNDYSFGKNREGNVDYLNNNAKEMGYEVIISEWVSKNTQDLTRISSTRIREIISSGQVSEAPELMGRHYQIRGRVEKGRNRGAKSLGFPTANISLRDELCPKNGVYAVTVEHRDNTYKGVANIGYSPTFDDHIFTVEVHILDFNENIYDHEIRVNFIERLRDEIKFSGLDELIDQIGKDIEKALIILERI